MNESVSLAETVVVEDDLGAPDGRVALREVLVERKVVYVRGEVSHPDGGVGLPGSEASAVVVELEPDGRVAVGDDFAAQAMHHKNCLLVTRRDREREMIIRLSSSLLPKKSPVRYHPYRRIMLPNIVIVRIRT